MKRNDQGICIISLVIDQNVALKPNDEYILFVCVIQMHNGWHLYNTYHSPRRPLNYSKNSIKCFKQFQLVIVYPPFFSYQCRTNILFLCFYTTREKKN